MEEQGGDGVLAWRKILLVSVGGVKFMRQGEGVGTRRGHEKGEGEELHEGWGHVRGQKGPRCGYWRRERGERG